MLRYIYGILYYYSRNNKPEKTYTYNPEKLLNQYFYYSSGPFFDKSPHSYKNLTSSSHPKLAIVSLSNESARLNKASNSLMVSSSLLPTAYNTQVHPSMRGSIK